MKNSKVQIAILIFLLFVFIFVVIIAYNSVSNKIGSVQIKTVTKEIRSIDRKVKLEDLLIKEEDPIKRRLLSEVFRGENYEDCSGLPVILIKEIIDGHFVSKDKKEKLVIAELQGLSHSKGGCKEYFVVYDDSLIKRISIQKEMIIGFGFYKVLKGKLKSHILFTWCDGNQGHYTWEGTLITFDEAGNAQSQSLYNYSGFVSKTKDVKYENNKLITNEKDYYWYAESDSFRQLNQ
ncbi:MAG: hypothetical protein A2452_01805 [Candidatus Firestonebacteria bacterium RIFOXYC2_FULL_39_67]|nr:MAG: hypothetical protein A2536_07315 [Candidatus Firestonebacteria bacterium RIFOXYD2_FULL_39_29]OGF53725.1 MAG: hypothetical protein A2452_01805 [Candidatus Firestonebacteria bacterium RIFOXYC2_FULL_39_67]